jgi:hypothetical protein
LTKIQTTRVQLGERRDQVRRRVALAFGQARDLSEQGAIG